MDKENLRKITVLRHELHRHAEISLQEVQTKKLLMDFLASNTSLEIVDRGKWFYAVYCSPAPDAESLLFRADFDALPIDETIDLPYASVTTGVSHKCGHDGHSACLAGLALEIDRLGSEKNIYFVFQHAEEIGAGGEACAALIEEKNIARAYAMHNRSGYPEGAVVFREGMTQCASEGLALRFKGKTAHASQPEDGRNPSKAIAELVSYACTFSRGAGQKDDRVSSDGSLPGGKGIGEEGNRFPSDLVLCTVTHIAVGSECFGISAGEGKVCLVLRANREADMKRLEERLRTRAAALCAEYGLTLQCTIHEYFPETRNHKDAIASVKKAAAALGKQTIEMPEPWRASEDFGYYTKQCPGAIFYIGNGEDYPQVHTEAYDYNDRILETGVDMFYQLTLQ